jgi:hypothetical protein
VSSLSATARGSVVAMLSWTLDRGCRLARFDWMLAPVGPTNFIYDSTCGALAWTTDGYTVIHESPETLNAVNTLTMLDASGALRPDSAEVQLADPEDDPIASARASLGPGRFLFVWRRRAVNPAFVAMPYNDDGRPLAMAPAEPVEVAFAFTQTGVSRGFGAAFAWWYQGGAMHILPFSREGLPRTRAQLENLDPDVLQVMAPTMLGERTVLLYAHPTSGGQSTLMLRELQEDGTHGPIFQIESVDDTSSFSRSQIVATSQGAVVVYTVRGPTTTRILARKVTCLMR